jgi:hypothetical protein
LAAVVVVAARADVGGAAADVVEDGAVACVLDVDALQPAITEAKTIRITRKTNNLFIQSSYYL